MCFSNYYKFWLQIFDLFDVKHKGVIDFGDFVRSLNVFHPNASQEDKINCKLKNYVSSIFRLYKLWVLMHPIPKLGMLLSFISLNDLVWMYDAAVSFTLYDLDGTGFIERQEVCWY